MASVGLFEAKTHLSALVERVERGEEIVITRHGTPVARLVPAGKRKDISETIARIKELRKGRSLKGVSVRQLIEAGRRF